MRPGMLTGLRVKVGGGGGARSVARSVAFSRSESAQWVGIIALAAYNTHVRCVVVLVLVVRRRVWTVVLTVTHRIS